jgi:cytochrome c-type protein NapC
MAQKIWREMKANDSHTCRSCHRDDKMDPNLQSEKAKVRHARAKVEGLTCIECHFAIAHKEPEGPGPAELFSITAAKPE